MAQTLSQAKENIWTNINATIIDIWPVIQIIFEQEELIQILKKTLIEHVWEILGDKSTEATTLIKLLNSKTKEELEELQIEDRTETI